MGIPLFAPVLFRKINIDDTFTNIRDSLNGKYGGRKEKIDWMKIKMLNNL